MKGFKVNDKVFGKVKGYPAWPAKITEVNGKRYSVVFYGTNETATIKEDNIFYYIKNKSKFSNQKRKFFAEAIADIEEDIKKCGGSDGNNDGDNETVQEEPTPKRTIKRKRNSTAQVKIDTPSVSPTIKRLKLADQNHNEEVVNNVSVNNEGTVTPDSTSSELIDIQANNKEETTNEDHDKSSDGMDADVIKEELNKTEDTESLDIKDHSTVEEVTQVYSDELIDSTDNEIHEKSDKQYDLKDINIVPELYLTAITTYADKVEENSHYYKTIAADPIGLEVLSDSRLKVLPVKIGKDKYSGIIYTPPDVNSFRCEYDRAMKDAKIVESILELKAEVEVNAIELTDERLIKNLGCDDEYIYKNDINQSYITYKNNKVQWVKGELEVLEHIKSIQKCLHVKEAKTEGALDALKKLNDISFQVISLKKRPFIMNTIASLRRYVGNIKDWNFSPEEVKTFEERALEIRKAAEFLFNKVCELFPYGSEDNFMDKFDAETEEFSQLVKDMSNNEIVGLRAEPLSRRAQMEMIFDEEMDRSDDTITTCNDF